MNDVLSVNSHSINKIWQVTYFPWAVAPDANRIGTPFDSSIWYSARAGVGCSIMLSSIFVATMTAFPMLWQIRMISSYIIDADQVLEQYTPWILCVTSILMTNNEYLQQWEFFYWQLCTKISSGKHSLLKQSFDFHPLNHKFTKFERKKVMKNRGGAGIKYWLGRIF